ncbi:MAG: hypothetical protein WBA53_10900 [Burkholderiaceae bacterium]
MRSTLGNPGALAVAGALLLYSTGSGAFTVNISAASPRTIYLQVGVGTFNGLLSSGGSPGTNPTINVVSVTVPAAQVGSGTAQTMTTNSTASRSFYDNFVFCNAPAQLYIGGFYRRTNSGSAPDASLTATAPANLVNASGDTIPFSQIEWTSSGIGDSGTQVFPAGVFTGGTQPIGTIQRNQWAESCHTFSYRNQAIVPAGTYTGTVTYTLSAP